MLVKFNVTRISAKVVCFDLNKTRLLKTGMDENLVIIIYGHGIELWKGMRLVGDCCPVFNYSMS